MNRFLSTLLVVIYCYFFQLASAQDVTKKERDTGNKIAESLGVASLDPLVEKGWTLALDGRMDEAVPYFRKAAQAGDAVGAFSLASVYYEGTSTISKDKDKAVALYRQAALKGYAKAQSTLATLYSKGDGVPKNLTAALYWAKKAAAGGDKTALQAISAYGSGDK